MENQIIPHQNLIAIVNGHDEAQQKVEKAFTLLDEAKKILDKTFGDKRCNSVLPDNCNDYDLIREGKRAKKIIKKQTWTYIFSKCQLEHMLSKKSSKNSMNKLKLMQLLKYP